MLAELNPYSERVWDYAAWHQAFNVAGRSRSLSDRFERRLEGLRLARAGLALRPDSRLLLVRLEQVSRALRETDAVRFARVTRGRPPEAEVFAGYRRMLARPQVVAADHVFLAAAALGWAVRLVAEGRPGEARPVLAVGTCALTRYAAVVAANVEEADPPAGAEPVAAALARALEVWAALADAVREAGEGVDGAAARAREAIRGWRALSPDWTEEYRSDLEAVERRLAGLPVRSSGR